MGKILSWLFPPKLPVFNIETDIPEIENYQYRISRRGVELNPKVIYAGSVRVLESAPAEIEEEKYFTVSGK